MQKRQNQGQDGPQEYNGGYEGPEDDGEWTPIDSEWDYYTEEQWFRYIDQNLEKYL